MTRAGIVQDNINNWFFSFALIACFVPGLLRSQGNTYHPSKEYEWPSDPLVKENLEQWRDQKFGVIIHFGLYAVPGMIESWALCSEDWITRL